MARYCPLFSGSSGNCTYLSASRGGGILVDVGVSAKRIKEALFVRNIDPTSLQGVFITHEHIDHVAGLKVLLKQFPMPIFATAGTAKALCDKNLLPPSADVRIIDGTVAVGDMAVTPFKTPHDSRESCGYRIALPDERTVAIATDIGYVSDVVREAVTGCDLVHIESNHDVRMVEVGPYPYDLKRRILGSGGHLSNDHCAELLPSLLQSGTTRFVLSHLSRENNLPLLAEQTALQALSCGGGVREEDFLLSVAAQGVTAPVMVF